MNKITIGILTAAMALSIGAAPSSGASPRNSDNLPGTSGGVCDNCGAYHFLAGFGYGRGYRFVDADGDGICDNYSGAFGGCMAGQGVGPCFTDDDGDGICDNYTAGCPAGGRGQGRGRGCRGGRNR